MSASPSHTSTNAAPASLKRIILTLARGPGFPAGSAQHGYEMRGLLRPDGHLDADGCLEQRGRFHVRRFWANEPDRTGQLQHRAGGAGGATWVIDYDEMSADDDEAGYRFDFRAFVPGEYVTIRDARGAHTFRVTTVEALPEAAGRR